MDITILGEDIMITMVMITDTLMTMDMIISTSTMSIRIKKNIYIVIMPKRKNISMNITMEKKDIAVIMITNIKTKKPLKI
jgi:hypothetical protein